MIGAPFTARYAGVCSICEERFPADTLVAYIDDEIAHETCACKVANGNTTVTPSAPPCPKCFTIPAINGKCGCDE